MEGTVHLEFGLKSAMRHSRCVTYLHTLQALELSPVNPDPQPSEAVCNGIRLPSATVRRGSTAAAGTAAAGRTGGSRAASRNEAPGDNEAESPPEVRWDTLRVYGQQQAGIMLMNRSQLRRTNDKGLQTC